MPQFRQYKSGSIIYFEGERKNNFAFLLKQGKCNRSKLSLETGMIESTSLVVGEFFGIKAALGVLPRDETIKVLTDSVVYVFTPQEFVEILSKNVSIIFKMLKAFSNELRRIHKAIESKLLTKDDFHDEDNPGKLKNIGFYYLKRKAYNQAKYVFNKFIEHYPHSEDSATVKKQLVIINSILNEEDSANVNESSFVANPMKNTQVHSESKTVPGLNDFFLDPEESLKTEPDTESGEVVSYFNELVETYKRKDFFTCSQLVKKINQVLDSPFEQSDLFEKFYLIKSKVAYFNDSYLEAINSSKEFVKNYPKSLWLWNALFVLAEAMLKNSNVDAAKMIYDKILSGNLSEDARAIIKKRLSDLE